MRDLNAQRTFAPKFCEIWVETHLAQVREAIFSRKFCEISLKSTAKAVTQDTFSTTFAKVGEEKRNNTRKFGRLRRAILGRGKSRPGHERPRETTTFPRGKRSNYLVLTLSRSVKSLNQRVSFGFWVDRLDGRGRWAGGFTRSPERPSTQIQHCSRGFRARWIDW